MKSTGWSIEVSKFGGTPKPLIPFFKRIGFLATDGSPTELYKRFRNQSESGAAVAEALRIGYQSLYTMNERAHELSDNDLKGLIVQATGSEKGSRMVQAIFGSYKILKQYADFKEKVDGGKKDEHPPPPYVPVPAGSQGGSDSIGAKMNLSYTINLNLPATTDISVFNAIFKSLKENLLKK